MWGVYSLLRYCILRKGLAHIVQRPTGKTTSAPDGQSTTDVGPVVHNATETSHSSTKLAQHNGNKLQNNKISSTQWKQAATTVFRRCYKFTMYISLVCTVLCVLITIYGNCKDVPVCTHLSVSTTYVYIYILVKYIKISNYLTKYGHYLKVTVITHTYLYVQINYHACTTVKYSLCFLFVATYIHFR